MSSTLPANAPSAVKSPEGRRILIAVVTGEAGTRIQAWREANDPEQARRLPPHTTLCYWAPVVDPALLERQVRHAFASPVDVRLGEVGEFDNDQHTFYVELLETAMLDTARARLYDGTHVALPGAGEWAWHTTCVRESIGRNLDELRRAARDLDVRGTWEVSEVGYFELRAGRYEPIATWQVRS